MIHDPTPHLERFGGYDHACREFRWLAPESFNIADAILSRHSDSVTRVALVEAKLGGLNTYTFGGLDYLSDKFASALDQLGVQPGDSVAVFLPQSAAAIIAQLGALKLGAIVVPLTSDLDASSLEFSLKDSAPRAAVVHHTLRDPLRLTGASIETVFAVNILTPEFQDASPDFDFWRTIFEASAEFSTRETASHSPAFVFYVATAEGRLIRTTHSHASLIYQLPVFEMVHGFQLGEPSTLWTPQDWASVDSTFCSVYPALWYGWRVAACEARLAIARSSSLIENCEITDLFATVAEVEELRESNLPSSESGFKLRNIVCTSAVPAGVHDWASQSLGASTNTVYSHALFGSVAASCKRWYNTPHGSLGRAAPGYSIETVDEQGGILPPRTVGRLAIQGKEPEASGEQVSSQPRNPASPLEGWIITNDVGFKDEDGNVWLSSSI